MRFSNSSGVLIRIDTDTQQATRNQIGGKI